MFDNSKDKSKPSASKRRKEQEISTRSCKGKEKVDSAVEDISEDESEDEIDWETIQLPTEEKAIYNDVEIVMMTPKKRKRITKSSFEVAYQRALRDWVHHSHIVCLTAHYKLRNDWCSRSEIKSVFQYIIPKKIQSASNIITGLKLLYQWWTDYFIITGAGLLKKPIHHFYYIKDFENLKKIIDKHQSNEEGDYIENFSSFLDLLSLRSGTRDTSAELFVAALRACGYETRLVCSLQPVTYKPPKRLKPEQVTEQDDEESSVLFEYRAPMKPDIDIDMVLKQSNAKPPTVWAEVFCPRKNRWITVDPIRGFIDQPHMMVPIIIDRTNQISFIIAFDRIDPKGRGNITDVTYRYTNELQEVLKERERPLTKKEQDAGIKSWSNRFLNNLTSNNRLKQRDLQERRLLNRQDFFDVMPTSIGKFHNHPTYAIEKFLKKFEVMYPNEHIGIIKGEKVYPRDYVKTVATEETYKKAGRIIKEGEKPVKMVDIVPFSIEKKRLKELARQKGLDTLVPCYGEWQTEFYVPPPLVDGKIVKSQYGTIELFAPTMLPKGAAHIQIKGISKMAKELGIDYAEAVVDFDFLKGRAVPVTDGIVIAEGSKQILLEAWEEYEQNEAIKAIKKQEKEVLIRWRKLIKALLIKARVDHDYGKKKEKEDVWSGYHQEGNGGGFLPED